MLFTCRKPQNVGLFTFMA
uniref:Uncharacterized protein n=1 Tax=Arundo donax TaxID=35708 RepID=A0A0A8Z429_ARUDO